MHCKFSTPVKTCLQSNSNFAAGNGSGKRGWVGMAWSPEFDSYYPLNRKARTGTDTTEVGNTEVGSTEVRSTEVTSTEARSWKREARVQKREALSQFHSHQLCNTNTTLCPSCHLRPADFVDASRLPLRAKGFASCLLFALFAAASSCGVRIALQSLYIWV